jgi:hypothetical protein
MAADQAGEEAQNVGKEQDIDGSNKQQRENNE